MKNSMGLSGEARLDTDFLKMRRHQAERDRFDILNPKTGHRIKADLDALSMVSWYHGMS